MNRKKLSFIVAILMIGFLVFGLTIMKIYNDYKKYHNYSEFEGVVTSVNSDFTAVGCRDEHSDEDDCIGATYYVPNSVFHKVGDEISIYIPDNCNPYNGSCDGINSKLFIVVKDFFYVLVSYLLINYAVISLTYVSNEQTEFLVKLDKKIHGLGRRIDNLSKK